METSSAFIFTQLAGIQGERGRGEIFACEILPGQAMGS